MVCGVEVALSRNILLLVSQRRSDLATVTDVLFDDHRQDAYDSNRGSWRQLLTKGTMSYREAVQLWVSHRSNGKIVQYP